MSCLCELALKYECDKCPQICHNYTPFYDNLFRYMNVNRFLEIGIYQGASLRMWRDYFPNAEIFGVDINLDTLFTEERIHTYQCDASNENELKKLMMQLDGNFDIILEDASHIPSHQILAGNILPQFLAPNGMFIMEDVLDVSAVD